MIQNVIRSLGGIDAYGVVSICLFFVVFVGVLWWAFRLKRTHLDSMAHLPLEQDSEEPLTQKNHHE